MEYSGWQCRARNAAAKQIRHSGLDSSGIEPPVWVGRTGISRSPLNPGAVSRCTRSRAFHDQMEAL